MNTIETQHDDKMVIISLGGSLIFPEGGLDINFVKKFKKLVEKETKNGYRFVIITGGGRLARTYIDAANKITPINNEEKDWMGIHATRMNAHFIKTVFIDYAQPRINKNPRTKEDLWKHFENDEKVMVAAGWRPGWSTDYVATILAERFKAKRLINLSDIEYLFDKDPNEFSDAKKIKEINWSDFRKIVGDKWSPGLSAPFDPIAAKLAQKNNMEVAIIGGKDLSNVSKYLDEKDFVGSVIKGL
jgi:uridylate kinase